MVVRYLCFIVIILELVACEHQKEQKMFVTSGRVTNDSMLLTKVENLGLMEEGEATFFLPEASSVRVYGTAEESIDLAKVDSVYLYKSDEMAFLIKQKDHDPLKLVFPLQDSLQLYSKDFLAQKGVSFEVAFDSIQRFYYGTFAMSLAKFSLARDSVLHLNMAFGDNDDKLKQKSRFVWKGDEDPIYSHKPVYGAILLGDADSTENNIRSPYVRKKQIPEKILIQVSKDQMLFGEWNKAEDFSAFISSNWTNDSLYLYYKILDNRDGAIDRAAIAKHAWFHDYGWIENEKGEPVWNMTNLHTKHAGGAAKNRLVDTVLFLDRGHYTLYYKTDESHSWDNWDDRKPDVGFWGIRVKVLN